MKTARQGWQAWLVTLAVAASIVAATAQDTNTPVSTNATTPTEPAAAPVETSAAPATPAPPRAERGTRKLDESAFRIISERNIFNANRSGGQVRLASRRPVSVETFTLVGTMAYERGAFAFFEGSRSDYTKALKAGDVIAGHKVADVLTDGVKLEADGKEIELLVGSQMRREDAGAWRMAEVSGGGGEGESRSYASSSYSSTRNGDSSRSYSRSDRGRSSDSRSRRDRSGDSSSDRTETTAKPAEASAPSAAEQAAALKRLLERKEKE